MRFGVLQFPGTCDERDALEAARMVGDAELIWHGERDLRGGAIARFSPAMEAVIDFAREGGLVLGICNGFQVLCEAQLLPGALLGNVNLRFTCRQVRLEVLQAGGPFTAACEEGELLSIPAKHSWGRYHAEPDTLARMREAGQVVLRYAPGENFNGSVQDIAGVCSEQGNVFGLMPHPEHAVRDEIGGSSDGLKIFESMRLAVEGALPAPRARLQGERV